MATALLLVIDATGITTLEYLLDCFPGRLHFPNLGRLGLGMLLSARHRGRFGPSGHGVYAARRDQASASADSVIGHREMMGVVDGRVCELFPNGFPADYIAELERRIGRKTMFNQMGGGVEVIERTAEEHAATGKPAVYASKCDPIVQIAMNEAVIPVAEQHKIADTALALALEKGILITRAIARSYIRRDGEYTRTANRHDATLPLPVGARTLVDILRDRGVWTVSVGKPGDLVGARFNEEIHLSNPGDLEGGVGLRFVHPKRKDTNPYTTQGVLKALAAARYSKYREKGTFVFANWVDGDALYGHTNDGEGALRALEEIDRVLPFIEAALAPGDVLIITADHGMEQRDGYGYHHREPVPRLVERIGRQGDARPLRSGCSAGLTEVGDLVAQALGCHEEFRNSIVKIPA